jgi:hypothetical protein
MHLDKKGKLETLKHTIDRYDHYYDSVNNKGNLYLTLGTFLLGGIITGFYSIKDTIADRNDILFFLWFGLLTCVVSLILTLWATSPYLSRKKDNPNGSVLFFGDVSSFSFQSFSKMYLNVNEEGIYEDYLKQVHLLALGLQKKFYRLQIASYLLIGCFICISIIGFKILK